jgi:hypothetical protein
LLARHLMRAGFDVRRIQRDDSHAHVWGAYMRRGRVPPGMEVAWAKRQVSLFLRSHGLRYPGCDVAVCLSGDRVEAFFLWHRGKPGNIRFSRAPEHGSEAGTAAGAAPG